MQSLTTISGLPEMNGRLGPGTRLVLFASGLVSILVPAWELRHAFVQFGWWTIACGVIVAGAWGVGLAFVACAVAGDSVTWTFEDAGLLVEQRSPLRRRYLLVEGPDIARTEIRAESWSEGPDTFNLVLHLRTGESLRSAAFGTRQAAEGLDAAVRARLGLA